MDVQLTTCIASFKVHVCAPKLHLAYIIPILFLISSTFCRSLQQNVLLFVCLRKLFQTWPAKLSAVWKKYDHVTPLLKSLSWWSCLLRTNCTYCQAIMAWPVSPLNMLHPNLIITYKHASYQKNNSEYSQKLNIDPSFQNSLQTSNFFLITALLSFGTT